ncbi:MAG TPA: hypothetical protein VNL71_08740 [Chloroflexota bacterium]|nr:hypothetical protein [Chloroflexota bacterium]
MKAIQGRTLQALRAAHAFIAHHAHRIPGVAESGAYRRLGEIVTEAETRASAQATADLAARSATRTFWSVRGALLRDHLAPIITIAAVEIASVPQLSVLSMPPRWASAIRLHGLAYGIASAAERHSDRFVAAGLSSDFADRTRAAADAMRDALLERDRLITQRVGARSGLADSLTAGRRVVHVLDAMMWSALKEDKALLAAWHQAQRVERPVPARKTLMLPEVREVVQTVHVQDAPENADLWWVIRMRLLRIVEVWLWRGGRGSRQVGGTVVTGHRGGDEGEAVVRTVRDGEGEVANWGRLLSEKSVAGTGGQARAGLPPNPSVLPQDK